MEKERIELLERAERYGWGAYFSKDMTIAHDYACKWPMPEGFTQWDISLEDGWTVAHVSAVHNNLPEGFNQWTLANKWGFTVAHAAASRIILPESFTQWDLVDNSGWTVAHEAARWNKIPFERFHQWGLKSDKGETVFEQVLYKRGASLSLCDQFTDWDMVINDNGETCRDLYSRFKGGKQ